MFICKSMRLANYLLKNNCRIIRIDKDQEAKDFLVFIFVKNEKLNKALFEWNKKCNV